MSERKGLSVWTARLRLLWKRDPKGMSIDLLRVGMGIIWALNLIFILAPSNLYFPMFESMASGFGQSTLGGPAFPDFVAAHAVFFAWLIALLTAYLAVAFLAGFTTRLACIVGGLASVAFLLTQFYATFALNGTGTDVGAHPLYLLIYAILFTSGAGQYFAFDHWVWASGKARFPRLSRWIASPRDLPCNATCPAAGLRAPGAAAGGSASTEGPGDELIPLTAPASATDRRKVLIVMVVVVLALAGLAVALHPSGNGSGTPPTTVSITGIVYQIDYPGNATSGGFGPASQNGCFVCAVQVQPGSSVLELVMLTNNHSAAPVNVTSMTVSAPFSLVSGPQLPQTVPVGRMWMFNIDLGAPTTPGSYVVKVTFVTN